MAAEIGRMVGLEVPIIPRRGQIVVTATVPPLLRHCLISAQYVAAKFNPQLAATGGMGFSLEQTDTGNILIGSTREFAGFDRRTTFDGIRTIAGRIAPDHTRPQAGIGDPDLRRPEALHAGRPADSGKGSKRGRVHHGSRPRGRWHRAFPDNG